MSEKSVAIITGAAQGIGAAITEALLKAGYKVCVTDIKEKKGSEYVEVLKSKYGTENAAFFKCDTTKESEYRNALDFTLKEFKTVDLLINNAGIIMEQDAKRTIDVNTMGPIYGCQVGLQYMSKTKNGKGGVIINTASMLGLMPYSAAPFYAASKHAVVGLTRSYGRSLHFERHGVIFMAICPSFVNTDLLKDFPTNTMIEGLDVTDRTDLMSPEYIAQGVLKLLEDKVNGSTLFISTQGAFRYIDVPRGFDDIPIE